MNIAFTPDACCGRPSIATMDHPKGYPPDMVPIVNRCCTRCWVHWYGPADAVKRYTRHEWDAWVAEGGLK